MKKYWMIAFAAFAMFSCSKEKVIVETEIQPFKYVFTVADKPSFEPGTRAGKENWVDGDVIRIVFDDQNIIKSSNFTTLEFKSGAWEITQGDITPNENGGTLDALYLEPTGRSINYYSTLVRFENNDKMGQYIYQIANDIPYTVNEDNTVEFSLSMGFEKGEGWTYVQFRVTDLEGNWDFIPQDSRHTDNSLAIWSPVWRKEGEHSEFTHEDVTSKESTRPMRRCDDGLYKYLFVNQAADAITITLKNKDTGVSYYKTFSKKITGTCAAVKFKGPQLGENGYPTNGWDIVGNYVNGHEYVDMGAAGMWATMNVGANKPEDYGDYFAWGETEPYYSSQDPLTWKEGKSSGYVWASYTKYTADNGSSFSKYNLDDELPTLQLDDDAAYKNWGKDGGCRLLRNGELLRVSLGPLCTKKGATLKSSLVTR